MRAKRPGFVFVLSLMTISGLLSLIAVNLARSATELAAAQRYAAKLQAFHIAEGGIDQALGQMANNTPVSQTATLISGVASVTIQDLGNGTQQITSAGAVPNLAQQTVEIVVPSGQSVFRWALFGEDGITVGSMSSVDGDLETNSTAHNAVVLENWSSIQGDIYVGAGPPPGDPNVVIRNLGATWNGTGQAALQNFSMPPITLPSGNPCGGPLVVTGGTVVIDLSDLATSCYSSLDVQSGSVRIVGNGQLVLDGINMQSGGQVQVEGTATIVTKGVVSGLQGNLAVSNTGSVRLYVTDRIKLGVQSAAGAQDATRFTIFYTGTEDVELGVQSGFKGAVYAPNATIARMSDAQISIQGALVGKRINVPAQSSVVYDDALSTWNGGLLGGGANARDVLSWRQR